MNDKMGIVYFTLSFIFLLYFIPALFSSIAGEGKGDIEWLSHILAARKRKNDEKRKESD